MSESWPFSEFLDRATPALWEARGAAVPHLHPAVIIRQPDGIQFGAEPLRVSAQRMRAALPDLAFLGEDTVWSGTEALGMLGAQRLLGLATHRGPGLFGAPSGRSLRFRMMVESYAKAGRISDIWRVCDTGAILRQLALAPLDWARAHLAGCDRDSQPFRPVLDVTGPYTGSGNDSDWGQVHATLLGGLLAGDTGVIAAQYDPACQVEAPGGLSAHGHAETEAFWMGLRASFPSARITIHHRIGMEEPLLPPRSALRWSLDGRHDGWGLFGAPTGAEVHVMGMAHAEFGPQGLRREWVLFDESAVWMQIAEAVG